MALVVRNVQIPVAAKDEWLSSCTSCSARGDSSGSCCNEADERKLEQRKWDVVAIAGRIAGLVEHQADKSPSFLVEDAVREDASRENAAELGLTAGDDEGGYSGAKAGGRSAAESNRPPGSKAVAPEVLEVVEGNGRWLVPGWVDVQVNDLEWISRWGTSGADAISIRQHADRIREVLRHQASQGVTGLCIATVASPLPPLLDYLSAMHSVMEQQQGDLRHSSRTVGGEDSQTSSFLHGAVVEGTFMNPEYHGCHDPKYVMTPSKPVLDQLLKTKAVKTVNIAPEMGSKAETVELIRHAVSLGVLVAAGHCKPHAAMMHTAIDAGCSYVIHLGNGPTGTSLKAACDGGMMEECLRNDDIIATIICDNHHIHPSLVRDWVIRKGIGRAVAVSDAAFALGVSRTEFEVFGRRGRLSDDGKCLVQADIQTASTASRTSDSIAKLFGSNATMHDIFENLVNMYASPAVGVMYRSHPALSLLQAVSVASALCSASPSKLLGTGLQRGTLTSGAIADMLLLDIRSVNATGQHASAVANSADMSQALPQQRERLTVSVDRVWCTSCA